VEIFRSLKQFIDNSGMQISGCVKICILSCILSLKSHSENYFPGLEIEKSDWIKDPFSVQLKGNILTIVNVWSLFWDL
jgi:hypothetical protein